jgi:hypothetical protein
MKKIMYPFLVIVFLTACESDQEALNEKLFNIKSNLVINHYQHPATGEGDHLAYVAQAGGLIGTERWNFTLNEIEGFQYEWGYVYGLEVKKEEIENPVADGSSIKLTLIKVLSKEKVPADTKFVIKLTKRYDDGGFTNFLTGDATSGYNLLNDVNIDCGDHCDDLTSSLASKLPLTGTFVHHNDKIKLVKLEVQ